MQAATADKEGAGPTTVWTEVIGSQGVWVCRSNFLLGGWIIGGVESVMDWAVLQVWLMEVVVIVVLMLSCCVDEEKNVQHGLNGPTPS